MKPRSAIRSGWSPRAISRCLVRRWRGCTILVSIPVALLAASWFAVDWTDAGSGDYPGGGVLRDSAGGVLRVTLGAGDVDCRPYYAADRGDWIVKALVAVEDGTFFEHHGVRPLSVLRAAFQNVFYRRRISGASTITMQAVRLMRPHPKTYLWKLREAVMAVKMERAKDKLWILSQYLNRAPFGSNLVGVEAAAQGWFGKGAKELGLGEAAMLAGMVQAPSRYRPDRGMGAAFKRRGYVLKRMFELGMIDRDQLEAAESVEPRIRRAPRPFLAPHFCDWWLASGKPAAGDVRTTLDADVQKTVEAAVDAAAAKGGYSSAAVVMRAKDGAVVALACSGDYFDPKGGQVNLAASPRPAGSTLKPFLTALAMDRGLVTPDDRLADVPTAYRGYRPANFDSTHRGLVTVRDALVLSLNVPFVRLLERVGLEDFGTSLRALGFRHMRDPDDRFGLGMAIGNVEVTLVELVAAYGALARGGDGVYSPGAAYLVADALSGDERSAAALGHVADVRLPRFAWKTGTSSAYRDAWTVAWNPEYVIGTWCGHKSGGFGDRTLVGAKAAAPVAWSIARSLYPQGEGPWFRAPPAVVRRRICAYTGLPANPCCPKTEEGTALAGISSPKLCEVHALDADGRPAFRPDAWLAAFTGGATAAGSLAITSPEADAKLVRVPGLPQQRTVCRVVGNPSGARLWWFVDGRPAGESAGSDPFPVDLPPGPHVVTCSSADGVSASVSVTVE